MPTLDKLKHATDDFFETHGVQRSDKKPPGASVPWRLFRSIPFNEHKGCYPQVNRHKVIYMGVALNSDLEGCKDRAFGTRIIRYKNDFSRELLIL